MFTLKKFILCILFTSVLFLLSNTTSYSQINNSAGSITMSRSEFKLAMRKLWEDHITWTRNVIFNIIDDLPGLDLDLARLLKNQVDIGDAVKDFYGDDA